MKYLPALLLAATTLQAQATYQTRPASDPHCPRVEAHEDTLFRTGGQKNTTGGMAASVSPEVLGKSGAGELIPKEARESGAAFAVFDVAGTPLKAADLKGRILVVGFWQTTCPPSINLLNELVDFQAKGAKFGFEVWPVCLDDRKWATLTPFANQNRKFLGATRLFTPGLGEAGPAVFMKVLPVLPALFILDREGRVAYRKLGYEPNGLVAALKILIPER